MDVAFLLRTAKLTRARRLAPLGVAIAFGLAGCTGPVGLYHDVEGGAIAQPRQPPPGADLPYPNLAAVPPAPTGLTTSETAAAAKRLVPVPAETPATRANQAALAGLTLPAGIPPVPNVPGLDLPSTPAPHVILRPTATEAAAPPYSAPVSLAFQPGSAIVIPKTEAALVAIAGSRGTAEILAGGFGDAGAATNPHALTLAVERAQAIADALTAAGAPPSAIRLTAAAAGSGGFVQLVY